jgi:dTDP-4-amino-4,6-dideoxygalactose transaminase
VRVPLVDLGPQHDAVAAAVAAGWDDVLARRSFVRGDAGAAFEREFAAFCRAAGCVGVANGTDALELSLRALGIGPGDEVVLPANTFVATAMAVVRAGAEPVLADVVRETQLVDVDSAEAACTARTRAIVPVHLFGQMADMRALGALAERRGVALVEDAAQAHGATQDGEPVGSRSAAAATSFYPSKNLGAYGDAGAVVTRDPELAERVRMLGNYGGAGKYEHRTAGFNSRLDELQAVVLRTKLPRLAGWNEQRRAAARRYDELLGDARGIELPRVAPGNEHVWHLYVVRVRGRDEVLRRLRDAGIGAAVHYPVPIHRQPAFAGLGGRPLPVADELAGSILSLPLFPGIRDDQLDYVAGELRRAATNSP